jgi:hypothetical protein
MRKPTIHPSTVILIASGGFARIIPARTEARLIADLQSIVTRKENTK